MFISLYATDKRHPHGMVCPSCSCNIWTRSGWQYRLFFR